MELHQGERSVSAELGSEFYVGNSCSEQLELLLTLGQIIPCYGKCTEGENTLSKIDVPQIMGRMGQHPSYEWQQFHI